MQLHAWIWIALPRRADASGQRESFQRFTLTLQGDDAAVEAALSNSRTDGFGQRRDEGGAGGRSMRSLDEHIDDCVISGGIGLTLRRTIQHEARRIVPGVQHLGKNA